MSDHFIVLERICEDWQEWCHLRNLFPSVHRNFSERHYLLSINFFNKNTFLLKSFFFFFCKLPAEVKEGSNRCRFSCIICITDNLLCYVSNIYLRIAIYRCMLLAVHISREKKLFFSIWAPSKNVSCLLKGGGVCFFLNIECRWKQKLASKNKYEECVGFCFNFFFPTVGCRQPLSN